MHRNHASAGSNPTTPAPPSFASLIQLTVTTTPKPSRPALRCYHSLASRGATRVSSRLFPDASTRPYCPEALFLFFSGKLSLPLYAQLIAQHKEDEPAAVSDAKTSFHRAKEADSFTCHRLRTDLPVSLMPDPASSHADSSCASPPAAALEVRPRIPSEQPHSQRATHHSLFFPTI